MLGNANMFQIVRRNVKHVKMCQVLRHAEMCKGVTMRAMEYQGNKREKKVKIQGNEQIIGLIIHQFSFSKRGMLGKPTLGANRCQVVVHSKCKTFLYFFSSNFQ